MVFKASDSALQAVGKGALIGGAVGLGIGLARPKTPLWVTLLAASGTVLAVKAL